MNLSPPSAPPSVFRILLVEDNPGDADLVREALATASSRVQIEHVDSLAEAGSRLAAGNVDVVLLDLSLPDATGLQAVERRHGSAPEVPIVVLTGIQDEVLGARALQAGAQDYLVKGQTDEWLLVRAIRYAIERQQIQAGRARLLAQEHVAPDRAELVHALYRDVTAGSTPPPAMPANGEVITPPGDDDARIGAAAADPRYSAMVRDLAASSVMTAVLESHEGSTRTPSCLALECAQVCKGKGVEIECSTTPGMALMSVRDHGIGVAPRHLERIFPRFERAVSTRQFSGLGLGLHLARNIAVAHGGSSVVSSELGQGATFLVSLPLVPTSVSPARSEAP